jgi:SAM-dependent methyltransferase
MSGMTPDERWLAAVWPFVRAQLPSLPAMVLEVGCGPLGGFVPALLGDGYDAVGVDPEAPEAPGYHRIEFESYQPPRPVDGVVACTSLHHVADPDDVLDRVAAALAPGGVLVVEWAWGALRRGHRALVLCAADGTGSGAGLAAPAPRRVGRLWPALGGALPGLGDGRGVAHRPGDPAGAGCAVRPAAVRVRAVLLRRPWRHPQADEQAAIDAGQIQATGIWYAGGRR